MRPHCLAGKPLLFLFCVWAVFIGASSLQAGRILVDFGVTTLETKGVDEAGRFWNAASLPPNTPGDAVTFQPLALTDDKGAQTGFTLKVADPFLGAFDSGDNAQELYPAAVGKDRWSLEKGKKESAALVISGLDPAVSYDFHFFGLRDAPITFLTKYSVNGKATTLAAQNNRSNLGSVTGVTPNADGTAKIEVSIADGPNGHLSALEITWGGDLPTKAGQFASAYRKPVAAPAPVATPRPTTSSPVVKTPTAPKPYTPPASSYSSKPKTPAPVLSKSQVVVEKSKGPLIAGILLLLAGLGLGGFSGYKLSGR